MIPEIEETITEAKESVPKRGKAGKVFLIILALLVIFGDSTRRSDSDDGRDCGRGGSSYQRSDSDGGRGNISVVSPVSGRIASSNAVNADSAL